MSAAVFNFLILSILSLKR